MPLPDAPSWPPPPHPLFSSKEAVLLAPISPKSAAPGLAEPLWGKHGGTAPGAPKGHTLILRQASVWHHGAFIRSGSRIKGSLKRILKK